MSYPKRHPVVQSALNPKDAKQSLRKEQMKNLLITKFKGKFQINAGTDDYADRLIREEVETFL